MGWDVSQPHWQRCHVHLEEEGGVVLVFKSGHDLPKFADRLTRVQRLRFWKLVQEWVELEKGNRDKAKKSDAKQSNGHCVHTNQRRDLVAKSHNG